MFYLSEVLNAPVESTEHERVGKIIDVLTPVVRVGGSAYPSVLLVEGEEEQPWRIPLDALERHDHTFHLHLPLTRFSQQPSNPDGQELCLAQEVLDKQVIDIVRKKAVRVNDIGLGDDWRILGVDATTTGLIRRLAPTWIPGAQNLHAATKNLIPWEQVEIIGPQQVEQEEPRPTSSPSILGTARTQSGQLAELHPADIAEIVHQLTPGQGARLIEGLDNGTAADVMEEIDTERQQHILENIKAERAADILETMEPDEAADLIARLPEERAQELLRLMTPEESEEVQELLEYEADSAGGLMTTDFIVIAQTRTVAEALESVRTNVRENDLRIAYVYCVADEAQEACHVLGVISIWELLIADTMQILQDIMETGVITVHPDTDAREVAETIAKYNLLAVPVVNAEGVLEGIVTVDDALDVLLPPERRRRPSSMY